MTNVVLLSHSCTPVPLPADQLMSLRDISAVASEQLPGIFAPFLEQAPDAVSGRRAQSRPGSASTLASQSSEQLSELGQMVLEHVRAQAIAFRKLQVRVSIGKVGFELYKH